MSRVTRGYIARRRRRPNPLYQVFEEVKVSIEQKEPKDGLWSTLIQIL